MTCVINTDHDTSLLAQMHNLNPTDAEYNNITSSCEITRQMTLYVSGISWKMQMTNANNMGINALIQTYSDHKGHQSMEWFSLGCFNWTISNHRVQCYGDLYCDVIMGTMASLIASLTVVHSTVYSGADQTKHQSSASLAFVQGIHWWPVNSPHKWPVTRRMCEECFHLMTSLCDIFCKMKSCSKQKHVWFFLWLPKKRTFIDLIDMIRYQ